MVVSQISQKSMLSRVVFPSNSHWPSSKNGIAGIWSSVRNWESPKMGPHGHPPSRVEARLMPQTKWRMHKRHHWKSATRLSSGNFQPVSEKELEKPMEKPGNMWICQCVTTEVMAMSIPKMMRNHRNWTSTPCSDKAMWSLPSRDFT